MKVNASLPNIHFPCMHTFKAFSFDGWEAGLEKNSLVSYLVFFFFPAILQNHSKINFANCS